MHGQRAVLCAQPDIGSGGQVELCKTEVSKLDVATCIIEDVGWLPARTGTTVDSIALGVCMPQEGQEETASELL